MKKVHKALKHLIIPHHENDYKPHLFRELGIASILFVSVFLLGASAGSSFFIHKTVLGASISSSVLIDYTNDSRIAYNEPPLVRNEKLDLAAQLKGEDMAKMGYFSHQSPEGISPWHWFSVAGYSFLFAGENLAVDFTESKEVQQAWLDSPTHRANLLNVKFKEIGIATVSGVYENNPTIYVVQMFGTPAKAEIKNTLPELVSTTTHVTSKAHDVSATVSTSSVHKNDLVTIVSSDELEVVKNTDGEEVEPTTLFSLKRYSTWYQRLIFGGPHYVELIYKFLILIIGIALVTMIMIEYKKQHKKHIVYGILLLLALTVFVCINKIFL